MEKKTVDVNYNKVTGKAFKEIDPRLLDKAMRNVKAFLLLLNEIILDLASGKSHAFFAEDKTREGWKLIENVPFDETSITRFEPVYPIRKGEYTGLTPHEMRKRAEKLNANLGQCHAEHLLNNPQLFIEDLPLPGGFHFVTEIIFPGTVWYAPGQGFNMPYICRWKKTDPWEFHFVSGLHKGLISTFFLLRLG